MPDQSLMPVGRQLPLGQVPAEGFAGAFARAGRVRRRRHLWTAGGSAVAASAVFALYSIIPTPSVDRLLPLPPATSTTSQPAPTPSTAAVVGGQGQPEYSPDPQQDGRSGAEHLTPAVTAQGKAETPKDAPRRQAADPDSLRSRSVRPTCSGDDAEAPLQGWCLSLGVPRGDASELSFTACVGTRGPVSARLAFPTSQEVDFHITDSTGRVVWAYDPLITETPAPAEQLHPNQCVTFQVPWSWQNEEGQSLAAGTYRLHGRVCARQVSHVVLSEHFTVEEPA